MRAAVATRFIALFEKHLDRLQPSPAIRTVMKQVIQSKETLDAKGQYCALVAARWIAERHGRATFPAVEREIFRLTDPNALPKTLMGHEVHKVRDRLTRAIVRGIRR